MIGKRVRLIATAAAVSAGLLMAAGAANASTSGLGAGSSTAQSVRAVPSSGALPAGMSIATVTHTPARVKINATTYCYYGVYTRVNGYEYGILQWAFAMNTDFCYNYSIVTYHHTAITQLHYSPWTYSQGPTIASCYAISGHPNCSGNHEHNESSFNNTKTAIQTWVTIDQYEQYNGAWHWTWNTHSI